MSFRVTIRFYLRSFKKPIKRSKTRRTKYPKSILFNHLKLSCQLNQSKNSHS